ncbi:MAG: cupin domain-containing protein [Thermoplasmata archaeon]|nr:cupin domain-containing protein [Thermoplasmata archaeon]
MDTDDISMKGATYGDMRVGMVTFNTEVDMTPLFKGLPNDMCQAPHWGYVFKGRMRVKYGDRDEVIEAGDTFYLEPGHTAIIEAGTELVEFSPKEELEKTEENIARIFQEMQGQE